MQLKKFYWTQVALELIPIRYLFLIAHLLVGNIFKIININYKMNKMENKKLINLTLIVISKYFQILLKTE